MSNLVLQGWEYDEIEETVTDLFEDLGFTEFPLDCFEVASKLRIDLKKYSEIPEENREMIVSKFEDGYGSYLGKYRFVIYYNDDMNPDRIRYTIWYEIAHIQLGHYYKFNKTQERMKSEANHFAVFAQAPMPAVIMANPNNEYDISSVFNLSLECAEYVYSTYKRVTCYPSTIKKIMNKRIVTVMDFSKIKKKERICV